MQNIYNLVKKYEEADLSGATTISKYVTHDFRETIEKIDAYLNSVHISGSQDDLGRDKPFFDIVTSAVNIWFRATDIDRSNIYLKPSKARETLVAFLANCVLQDWMKKSNFGSFLNNWGRTLARYGSAVVKAVEKGGELYIEVVPWQEIICDPVSFDNNAKIQKIYLTEADLKSNKSYNKEVVESLCNAKTTRKTIDGQTKDNKADYILIYEVQVKETLAVLKKSKGEKYTGEDEEIYVDQMHVVSFVGEGNDEEQFTLISGKRDDPYRITHLIKEDGRILARGAVEHLFEAQWMVNHTAKAIKDQLDLASKLFFQTSDGSFVGQNTLTGLETGDILVHAPNQGLTAVNAQSHDIGSLQSFSQQWQSIGNQITGVSEAMMGEQKSGTAWRQTEALLQESHSLFELMTENKGLHLEEDVMRPFVIPHLLKKLDTTDEVVATLDMHGIDKIEEMYVKNTAIKRYNDKVVDKVLNGEVVDGDQAQMIAEETKAIQEELSAQGGNRFFKPSDIPNKTWKELFKDFAWTVEVDVTGEGKDSKSHMATLTTIFQTLAARQGAPFTDEERLILNKILNMTGAVSPIEIQNLKNSTPNPALAGGGTAPTGGAQLQALNQ